MDIRCVVCGEPWDSYGIDHGDMEVWEARLFRAGSGCPCCEGVSNGYEPEVYSDIENGDGDPGERLNALEAYSEGVAPPWIEPKPEILWTCESCGVCAQKNSNGELEYDTHDDETPSLEPDVVGEYTVCPMCVKMCEECNCALVHIDGMDCDETGYAFDDPRDEYSGRVVCYDCLFTAEDEIRRENWQSFGQSDFADALLRHFGLTDRAERILSDRVCEEDTFVLFNAHAHYDDENPSAVAKRCTRKEVAELLRIFRHDVY